MSRDPFLHDHPEFKALLQIVSDAQTIAPQLIEKDYWIMQCLWGLQQNLEFELKGGTSLSKGFGIIDRFSEDLDIRISPPSGMDVKTGKNHDRPSHIKSRKKYFDWLIGAIKVAGIVAVQRDTEYDDADLRNAGIILLYKSHFPNLVGVKAGVLLEVGFDDTAPNREVTISSWAFERATDQKVSIADNRAVAVKCYCPEYTFVEKLQTISTKFRMQQADGTFPKNFMRHYYDVHQLLAREEVQRFMGTAAYETRKQQRFRKGDNLKISENEAFLLRDPKTREQYEKEYLKTASLYYKGQVPLADILERIAKNLDRL